MNYSLMSIGVVLLVFAIFIIIYEKKKVNVKEISLIATISAIAGIGRVPFVALPNIQPTTFIVILAGYVFGPIFGFMVGIIATFVSSLFLGFGAFTFWQMFAWGLAGLSGGLLKYIVKQPNRFVLAIFAFLWGYLFGLILNVWYWMTFTSEMTFAGLLAVFSTSIYFDTLHAIFNCLFTLFFGIDFIIILSRFKDRISYEKGINIS